MTSHIEKQEWTVVDKLTTHAVLHDAITKLTDADWTIFQVVDSTTKDGYDFSVLAFRWTE